MTPACVYSDGCCLPDYLSRSDPGGWAAVVEDGHAGFVVRGGEAPATSTRMELRAAIHGLRAIPTGREVRLYFDCTAIFIVRDRRARHSFPSSTTRPRLPADLDLWLELSAELDRVRVEFCYLDDLPADEQRAARLIHRRSHIMAREEAVRAAGGDRAAQQLRARQAAHHRRQAVARQERLSVHGHGRGGGRTLVSLGDRLGHLGGCDFALCVAGCPVARRRQALIALAATGT